jgi:serine/threonine protein kinase
MQERCNMGDLLKHIRSGALAGRKHLKRCLLMALDVAKGLAYMHEHLVMHLDLKPQNVLLHRGADFPRPICKLADFGAIQDRLCISLC